MHSGRNITYECCVSQSVSQSVSVILSFNPLSANPTKWSNTLKQFVGKLPTICLSVFDHFVGLELKGLNAVSDDALKRKCLFNEEIMFYSAFKKDTEKVVLLN